MILVTGGSGYLGGRIVKYLRHLGIQVKVGDRDIFTDQTSLEEACRGISAIIHLAAVNAQDSKENPEKALMVNSFGTLRLLMAAEKQRVEKFIYFSTVHIYGSPLKGSIDEISLPRPLHHYSITHRVAEDYVLEANQRGKLSGVIFRLSNAVGAPINKTSNCWMLVVNDLCKQVIIHHKMNLHSEESEERDFISISEVCVALSFALKQDSLDGEIVNISSGKSISLKDLTNLISDRAVKILGYKPTVNFIKKSKNKQNKLIISNEKLKKVGLLLDPDISHEIDQLLLSCNQWFRMEK
jgi:UDP-glucose 4-epimerase